MLRKKLPEHVGLLRARGLHWESVCCCGHLLVADDVAGMGLDVVDPGVTDAIAELFLLSPQDLLRKVCAVSRLIESLAQDPLLRSRLSSLIFAHLLHWVEAHGDLHKPSIQERHACLYTPCHHGFVRPQTVVQVELLELSHVLCMEFLWVWSLVEVQITSKDLIGALTTQNHLHTGCPDASCHQVHWCSGPDGCDVEGFQMINHIWQGIQTFLRCKDVLMVHGTQVFGHLFGRLQVRAALEANAEGMELRPGVGLSGVCSPLAVPGHDGCHQRGVKAARKQHSVGHVRHHVRDHSFFKGLSESRQGNLLCRHRSRLHPARCIEKRPLARFGVENAPWREFFVSFARLVKCLQLA
mmetsp:Transcript_30670/g.55635  ORF Transcript_30670/g.55635 Transcript_30670/m.55635 type:complete len:354 (+) Transcript_30670:404-1465(+)